jgi:lysophospholipase L1-like esterase
MIAMKLIHQKLLIASMLLALMSFTVLKKKYITVYMIGDSTMSIKQPKAFPETGWGMELGQFFDKTVTIDNRAQNGRSTLSFQNENRWQPVVDNLKQGDYVIIEFGHNDEKIDKPNVGTTLEQFRDNLIKFVNDTRSKKATPILMTPISRRSFKNGILTDTHKGYPDVVRKVADSLKVSLVDMLAKTEKWLKETGDEPSKKFFNYVEPGHANYPDGKKDDTHLSPEGAKAIAALAVEGIKELKLELAERLTKQ